MPDYNTPGIPDPNVSATAQRAKTAALPDDTNVSPPRCYGQAVEAPNVKTDGFAEGYQSQYVD